MQFRFPGSISIIGRNSIDGAPGCGPVCIVCIIPDHAGRGERRYSDMFHRVPRASLSLSWYSSVIISWYFSFARPVHGPGMWLILTRPTPRISSFVTVTRDLPGALFSWSYCTQFSHPMVHTLWSTLSAPSRVHFMVHIVYVLNMIQLCEVGYVSSRS